jgi:hypothetical protein
MTIFNRRLGPLLAVALLVAALPITAAAGSARAASSPTSLPTWAHGSVTGAGPHNGVRLELVAWPKAKIRVGQTVHLQVVGKATSGSSGSYSIKPTVTLPGGLHNLEILARSRVAVGAFSFPRTVVRKGRALIAVDNTGSSEPATANIRMMAIPKSALPAVPHFGVPLCGVTSRKIKEFGLEMVDVGGLYSLMSDGKMKETYSAGSATTLGVGISLPEDFGSFGEEGTFTETSSGAETFPALVGKIVNEQTPYDYGEYTICGLMQQVQPEGWATGRHTVKVKPPLLDKCGINLGPGGTFTRNTGTAGTFKAGVDLEKEIGISLSAESGYNKDVSVKYAFPHEGGYMCGSNGYPTHSAWDLMSPCDTHGHCVQSSSQASLRAWAWLRGASRQASGARGSR